MAEVLVFIAVILLCALAWSAYCAVDYRREAPRKVSQGNLAAREGLIIKSREYYAFARDYRLAARWHTVVAGAESLVLVLVMSAWGVV